MQPEPSISPDFITGISIQASGLSFCHGSRQPAAPPDRFLTGPQVRPANSNVNLVAANQDNLYAVALNEQVFN